jgi:arylsulfatase
MTRLLPASFLTRFAMAAWSFRLSRLIVAGALFAASDCDGAETKAPAAAPPNVIIFLTDDQGYGDVGCFGAQNFTTPNFDRLAREGTRFTNFLVAQPVCTASRAALLTGCYANRVGMSGALNHTSRIGINPDETLLPELCKAKGYATATFGKWHLGTLTDFFPLRNGFDEWLGIPYSNDNGPMHPTIRGLPPLPLYEGDQIVELNPDQRLFTRRLTERAVQFIQKNKDRPFFLYLAHVMPHVPIAASEEFRKKTKAGLYGDVIAELDWSMGEIVASLEKQGLSDRTLLIFTSDNGPFLSYGEHAGSAGPLRGGKLTCFEGGVREPCIMRWPGHIPADRVCDELVSSSDLLPTIAGLIGAPLPERKLDGLNVWPLLSGATDKSPRESFLYFNGDELHAVRIGDWKLHLPHDYLVVAGEPGRNGKPSNWGRMQPRDIEDSGIRGIASRHGYRVEHMEQTLYNLRDDIGEKRDVTAGNSEMIARLESLAAAARGDLGDSLTGTTGAGRRSAGKK